VAAASESGGIWAGFHPEIFIGKGYRQLSLVTRHRDQVFKIKFSKSNFKIELSEEKHGSR
jgi:hypothetical protein